MGLLRTHTRSRAGMGSMVFLCLFALPFAGFGCFMSYKLASYLADAVDVRYWQPVPAKIEKLELIKHRSSSKNRGYTYKTEATYSYELGGTLYRSARVALSDDADNIGNFQNDAYRQLKPFYDSKQSFTAYVDPEDPSSSILFKTVRWGLISLMATLASAFLIIGFGLMLYAFTAMKEQIAVSGLAARHPNSPWLHKTIWEKNRIPAGSGRGLVLLWIFALLVLLPTIPAAIPAIDAIAKGNFWMILLLLVPVIGISVLYWTIVVTLRWKRFGRSVLEMKTFPGRIGEKVSGAVLLPDEIPPTAGVTCSLTCEEQKVYYSGGKKRTRTEILWTERCQCRSVARIQRPFRQAIEFEFDVPADLPFSQAADPQITWWLRIESELEKADLKLRFEIPVF